MCPSQAIARPGHRPRLAQAAITALKMGAQPQVMPPTGQYLTLNVASPEGYLAVYTDAPALMEYQVPPTRGVGGHRGSGGPLGWRRFGRRW